MPNLLQKIKLLWTFYRSFLFASLLISACGMVLAYEYGVGILEQLWGVKAVGATIITWFMDNYNQERYYYYHNLGLSKNTLWLVTILFDSALYLVLILITLHYRP